MKKFENKIWLSLPTMHSDELKWITDALEKNWITVSEDVNEVERLVVEYVGCKYVMAFSC